MRLSSNSRLLDLGSGFGLFVFAAFAMTGCHCVGVERGQDEIQFSENHVSPHFFPASHVSFVHADITSLSAQDYLNVTHVYAFDLVFEPPVRAFLVQFILSLPNITCVCVSHRTELPLPWQCVFSECGRLKGSGGSATMQVFHKA
jgi:cyclopropane fatty-acyl-phospholipid synthase-like methyltransferase